MKSNYEQYLKEFDSKASITAHCAVTLEEIASWIGTLFLRGQSMTLLPYMVLILNPKTFKNFVGPTSCLSNDDKLLLHKMTFVITEKIEPGIAYLMTKDTAKLMMRARKISKYSYRPVLKIEEKMSLSQLQAIMAIFDECEDMSDEEFEELGMDFEAFVEEIYKEETDWRY